jgi:hypothetical protein
MELELKGRNRRTVTNDRREKKKKNRRIWSHYRRIEEFGEFGALSIQWPDRSDPNFCLCINGKIWSMFLRYLAKMDFILILSKFSGQIGPKPKRFVFHSTI